MGTIGRQARPPTLNHYFTQKYAVYADGRKIYGKRGLRRTVDEDLQIRPGHYLAGLRRPTVGCCHPGFADGALMLAKARMDGANGRSRLAMEQLRHEALEELALLSKAGILRIERTPAPLALVG